MRRISGILVAIVLILVAVGIVMLASTSSVRGGANYGDPEYYLKRQLVWLFIALIAGAVCMFIDYRVWKKIAIPLTVVIVLLLTAVLHESIGTKIGGSRRWLRLAGLSLQPSELAKLVTVIALSSYMTAVGRRAKNFKEGLLVPVSCLGVITGLIFLEPDFGTTILVGSVGMAVIFAGGAHIGYVAGTCIIGFSAFCVAIMYDAVRMRRILAFLMPNDPEYASAAYHLTQSKFAFIKGGLFGVGLGNSIQKQLYLPEAHTDFILAIIGEELGFLATCIILALFAGILICGMIISFRCPDKFGKLLAFGITMLLTVQAAINIGVVTGCLPTKGLPLPFISYGGTSLLVSIACVGILLNIGRSCVTESSGRRSPRIIRENI